MLKLTVFYFIGIGNSYPFVSYVVVPEKVLKKRIT